jgi:hypothetical protein
MKNQQEQDQKLPLVLFGINRFFILFLLGLCILLRVFLHNDVLRSWGYIASNCRTAVKVELDKMRKEKLVA